MDLNRIDLNTPLRGPNGPDSLEIVELVMALEEGFDIEIPDEDAEKLYTVGDVANYIQDKAKPRQPRESLLRKIWELIQQVLSRVRR